jgi:hypothetical protein
MQQSIGVVSPGAVARAGNSAIVVARTGLRLLGEAGESNRLGDPVEDSIDASDVRWVAVDGDDSITVLHGSAAERLSLPSKTWSTLALPSACWVGDRLGGLNGSPIAYTVPQSVGNSSLVWPDDPQIITPWYRPAGDMGELRLYRLWLLGESGRTISSASTGMTVEIAYNYSATYSTIGSVPANQIPAGNWIKRYTPGPRPCRSFRLRITFPRISSSVPNPKLTALRFHVATRSVRGALLGGNSAPDMVNS